MHRNQAVTSPASYTCSHKYTSNYINHNNKKSNKVSKGPNKFNMKLKTVQSITSS